MDPSKLLEHPFAIWLLSVNPLTWLVYGIDKLAAIRGWYRVPELVLLLLGLAWGWPGALIGQQCFRHKTKKQPFKCCLHFTVVINLVVSGFLIYFYGGSFMASVKSVTEEPANNATVVPLNITSLNTTS